MTSIAYPVTSAAKPGAALPWGPMVALAFVWLLDLKVAPYNAGITDLGGYQATAQSIADGSVPYRDFFFEYPPLAAGVMVVAGWIGGLTTSGFENGMAVEMLLFALVMQACAHRLAPPGRKALVAWSLIALPILMGTLVRERFDVAPTAICIAAVLALARDRHVVAGALIGVGAALKLFPLIILPVAVVWLVARGRGRAAWLTSLVAVAVAVAVCVPFYALSPHGFSEQFRFHADRPVQIESTPASLLFAMGSATVVGVKDHPSRFRSQGFEGGPEKSVRAAFQAGQIVLLVLLLIAVWRATVAARARPEAQIDVLVLGALAGLLAFMAFGKVFSVQYMIWLAPFAALAWARGQREVACALAAAFVLTWAYYPAHYWQLVFAGPGHTAAVLDVAARNAVLAGALLLLLARLWSRPADSLVA